MLIGRFLAGLSGSGFLTVSGGSVSDLFVGSQVTLFHTNLLFFRMGSESLRAVLGARMIRLSLCFRSQIAPKLPAPSRFPGIYSANLLGQIQAPMMLFTITPFIGPSLGPIIGGFINQFTTW
jgi:hypothetical protein